VKPDFRKFVDLEQALEARLLDHWREVSEPVFREIKRLCGEGRFDEARLAVQGLDATPLGTENREWLKFLMQAFAVHGASVARGDHNTFVAAGGYDQTLNAATNQILQHLALTATQQVRDVALQSIAQAEATVVKADHKSGIVMVEIAGSDVATELDRLRTLVDDADLAGDGKDIDGNHVTIRYGLRSYGERLIEFLRGQASPTLLLGKVRVFPASEHSGGACPVVVDIYSEGLQRINAEIDGYADWEPRSFKEYHPHATLAYVKPETADRYRLLDVHGCQYFAPWCVVGLDEQTEQVWFHGDNSNYEQTSLFRLATKYDPAQPRDKEGKWTTGGLASGNYPLADKGALPLARGADWGSLNRHRDKLLQWAKEDGSDIDGLIERASLDELVAIAHDDEFRSKEPETVFFGLDGQKFTDMKAGDEFSALGMRSTTADKKRAVVYAGSGAVFQVTLPKGTRAVRGKVLGIEETTLLPGAKFRVTSVKDGVKQLELLSDGTDYIKELGHFRDTIDVAAVKYHEVAKKAETHVLVQDPADAAVLMQARLNASRLSSWGFLAEAYASGDKQYKITNSLEGNTCGFCRMVNGKTFSVEAGRKLVVDAVNAEDPNDLKQIMPWPKTDQESLATFADMDTSELESQGYALPPFHPNCKCQLVPVGEGAPREAMPDIQEGDQLVPAQIVTQGTFAELGLDATPEDVEQWNAYMRMSPVAMLAIMSGLAATDILAGALGKDPIGFEDGDITTDLAGVSDGAKFDAGTDFDPMQGSLSLTRLDLTAGTLEDQTAFLRQYFGGVLDVGISSAATEVNVQANAGEAPDYLRLGFLPEITSWDNTRQEAQDGLLNGPYRDLWESMDDDQKTLVSHLLQSSDPDSAAVLAALDFHGSRVGDILLAGMAGLFTLDLQDQQAVQQAREYLG
jgi:hypothetical protein